jgi:hypothetical protein
MNGRAATRQLRRVIGAPPQPGDQIASPDTAGIAPDHGYQPGWIEPTAADTLAFGADGMTA